MLRIVIPGEEYFNENTQEFETHGDFVLELEHSLISLSKWESRFEKPFLTDEEKTSEETISYIESMILTPDAPEDALNRLTNDNVDAINDYISAKRSATWFSDFDKPSRTKETITSELIYYWMLSSNIPIECETWHLNRLFTLIKICSIKNDPNPKKMSKAEIAARNRSLNAQRKAKFKTKG